MYKSGPFSNMSSLGVACTMLAKINWNTLAIFCLHADFKNRGNCFLIGEVCTQAKQFQSIQDISTPEELAELFPPKTMCEIHLNHPSFRKCRLRSSCVFLWSVAQHWWKVIGETANVLLVFQDLCFFQTFKPFV